MALHGFNDAGWAQYKADRKQVHGGKRQIHLRKNFTRKGRAAAGKATIVGALAVVTANVPASSGIAAFVDTDTAMVTPGKGGAAYLVGPDGKPLFDEPMECINPSLTVFTAEGDGVFVAGSLVTEGEGEEAVSYFLLPTSEIRTRPGYDETKGNLVMVQPGDAGAESVVGGWSANDKSLGADTTGDAEWQDDGECDE